MLPTHVVSVAHLAPVRARRGGHRLRAGGGGSGGSGLSQGGERGEGDERAEADRGKLVCHLQILREVRRSPGR